MVNNLKVNVCVLSPVTENKSVSKLHGALNEKQTSDRVCVLNYLISTIKKMKKEINLAK